MRVLLLYPYLPFPGAPHGSARLLSSLLAELRSEVAITLVCGYRERERARAAEVEPLVHRLVAVRRPFASDLGGLRRLAERGLTASRLLATGWPVPVVKLWRPAIRAAVEHELATGSYDLVHAELATMAAYGSLVPQGMPSVLVDHEAGGHGNDGDARWLRFVKTAYGRFDRIAALSEEDADALSRQLGGREVLVRPPAISLPRSPIWRPEPGRVLFVGSAAYAPNRDALGWIADSIWPEVVRAHPGARLVCAGFGLESTPLRTALEAKGATIIPFAEDLAAELARASLLLAPVREGRGVRIKILEALAHGVPVVSTPLGAQGLGPLALPADWIGADAQTLAAHTARIARDPEQEREEASRVRARVHERHAPAGQARATLAIWRSLLSRD